MPTCFLSHCAFGAEAENYIISNFNFHLLHYIKCSRTGHFDRGKYTDSDWEKGKTPNKQANKIKNRGYIINKMMAELNRFGISGRWFVQAPTQEQKNNNMAAKNTYRRL